MRWVTIAMAISVIWMTHATLLHSQPSNQMVQMKALAPNNAGAGPVIIGGTPANAANWPATLIFDTAEGFCTSTVVGDRIVLTAAHCVDDGAQGSVTIGASAIMLTCRHHPLYKDNYTADVAVCVTSSDVPVPSYERINVRLDRVKKDDDLTLLGYGCRQPQGGGPNRVLYEGTGTVDAIPGANPANYYTTTLGGAAVCFGDSGGAAYKFDGAFRYVAAITSRGDIIRRSLLTTISLPHILDFVKGEAGKINSKLCGIDTAAKCRS